MSSKLYKVLKDGIIVESTVPGKYAGCKRTGIFGNLTPKYVCSWGLQMRKESRVFFLSLEDAIANGYRPCKGCKPVNRTAFETIKHLVPFETMEDFYNVTPIRKSEGLFVYPELSYQPH
jgi:hypothetical protein